MQKQWKQWLTLFWGALKSLQMVIAAMKLKDTPWKETYDQPRQHIEKQRHYFANKGPSSQSYGFSNSHIWMWELDHKEGWVPKNWCFWTVAWRKLLRVPWTTRRCSPWGSQRVNTTELLNWTELNITSTDRRLFPPKIRSKTRIFALALSVQYCVIIGVW